MDWYTSEDARKEWRRILNEAERGEPVGVTRYGKPLAIVMPAEWYSEQVGALMSGIAEIGAIADEMDDLCSHLPARLIKDETLAKVAAWRDRLVALLPVTPGQEEES